MYMSKLPVIFFAGRYCHPPPKGIGPFLSRFDRTKYVMSEVIHMCRRASQQPADLIYIRVALGCSAEIAGGWGKEKIMLP
jgi:hypothetical protein